MKLKFYGISIFAAITILGANIFAQGTPDEVRAAQAQYNKVLEDAGRNFKDGLEAFKANKREDSGTRFDKAVEVFLYSSLNIQSDARLQGCYQQLIETVYRLEFPNAAQLPQIRQLSATCGWNWNELDQKLADEVAQISRNSLQTSSPSNSTAASTTNSAVKQANLVGFNEQSYEPSPLDELSKLELTQDELQVETNPVAQQQYQYIQYVVANKSLGFSFQVHPMIQQYINYYRGRGRSTMEIGLYRSGMFMRMARRIFKEEGVPENVAWLGQVESAWKPSALSSAAASGLWQFIPGTGNRFGLQRTAYVDERNSFEEATRASARYLKFLANRYGGNWELAMAAYNSGEGNVDRAIARAGASNFWVAYPFLPKETRNYVPNILATILIANNPQRYGFGQVRPAPALNYAQIRVPPSTSLGLLAQASDTSVEYLRYLNPELRSNMSPPEPYNIRVPAGKANEVFAVLRRVPSSNRNNATVAKVIAGETLENVSRRTGVPVEQLQAVNGSVIPQNGKIIVTNGNKVNKTSYQRPTTPTTTAPTGGVRVVKAQSGDTVAKLA